MYYIRSYFCAEKNYKYIKKTRKKIYMELERSEKKKKVTKNR
jgi:hypothetical protein